MRVNKRKCIYCGVVRRRRTNRKKLRSFADG